MKRKKIGLLFLSNYKEWAGGVIYVLNIIRALQLLEDEKKPVLYIYHRAGSPISDIMEIQYPYIHFFLCDDTKPSLLHALLNYGSIIIRKKSIFFEDMPDVTYPDFRAVSFGKTPVHWIPDFQDYYLPDMFSETDKKARRKHHASVARKRGIVVFSSQDAMNDFKFFYPKYNCQLRLLRFACSLPEYKSVNICAVKKKFGIDGRYFMSPNQFWKHKNQLVILQAIALLKPKNLDFQVAFTGTQGDHRNKDYFESLQDFIRDNQIERWVKMLGFINRGEQLQLMDNSIAIIQSSLFEGWSTVVEDSKALGQYIVLSNLKVHREQIRENCSFFDPQSPQQLAGQIEQLLQHPPIRSKNHYSENIKKFATDFIEVVNN